MQNHYTVTYIRISGPSLILCELLADELAQRTTCLVVVEMEGRFLRTT